MLSQSTIRQFTRLVRQYASRYHHSTPFSMAAPIDHLPLLSSNPTYRLVAHFGQKSVVVTACFLTRAMLVYNRLRRFSCNVIFVKLVKFFVRNIEMSNRRVNLDEGIFFLTDVLTVSSTSKDRPILNTAEIFVDLVVCLVQSPHASKRIRSHSISALSECMKLKNVKMSTWS